MNNKNKEKRIDKEIFILRNLPKEYKIGRKETKLGTLIDVSEVIGLTSFLIHVYSLKSIAA